MVRGTMKNVVHPVRLIDARMTLKLQLNNILSILILSVRLYKLNIGVILIYLNLKSKYVLNISDGVEHFGEINW